MKKPPIRASYPRVLLLTALWVGSGCRNGFEILTRPDAASGVAGSNGAVGSGGSGGRTGSDGMQSQAGTTGSELGGAGVSSPLTGATNAGGSTGSTGLAGAANAGGSTGSAGAANAGGSTGLAGATNVGGSTGSTGSAGATNAGGSTGSAGATNAGGSMGSAGATSTASGGNGTGGVAGSGASSSPCQCIVGQGCSGGVCVAGKIVFVTSQTVSSVFGGVAGADQICTDSAAAAGLPGQYLVWMSDAKTSPATRFTQSTIPYVLVNGTVVANDWADLIDGQLAVPININELGITAVALEVWTGTFADGTASADNCKNWKSSNASEFALQGVTDLADTGWTEIYLQYCDRALIGLLCFQQ